MNTKRLFPIVLIIFTNILGAGVIIPILPLYAEGQFAGSVQQVTLLSSAFFGAQFLAAPWLGRLSDRYGRRPLLLISQFGTVLAFILFIFAGPLGSRVDALGLALPITGGMFILFAARILDGITGGNITIAQAYVSDVTTPDERARGLGLLQAGFGAGFVFGPAFGGFLSSYGPVAPFIGATIITTGTLLLTFFTLKESHPPEERGPGDVRKRTRIPVGTVFANPALRLILGIGFLSALAFAAMPATFALFANHVIFADAVSPERIRLYIGLMLAFNGLTQVFTQLALLRRLVARFGERRLLAIGLASIAVAQIGMALAVSPVMLALMLGPYSFGFGVSEPSVQSLITRFATDQTRGHLLGLYASARSSALIVGPIWAGFVFQNIEPRAVYMFSGAFMSFAFIGALSLLRRSIEPIRIAAN